MSPASSEPIPESLHPVGVTIFGDRLALAQEFTNLLASEGEIRGLIGPRETGRLWERHVLNSAVLVEAVQPGQRIIDVGSGAGFPGLPLAIACPEIEFVLVEPMERRVEWLHHAVSHLELENVSVVRGRAGDRSINVSAADVVTARAVAEIGKLWRWSRTWVRRGGSMIALKGKSAEDELAAALPLSEAVNCRVLTLQPKGMPEPTFATVIERRMT